MNRKRERNELLEFLGGAAMLSAGLYFFCNKVQVSSSFFGGGYINIGGFNMSSGLAVVPFIIGIVILFANPDNFLGKLVTTLGMVVIIASIIATTQLRLPRLSLYEWLTYLVLIFGGFALVARVLFANPKYQDRDKDRE